MEPEKSIVEGPTKLELKKLRKLEKLKAKRAAAEELTKACLRDHLKREQHFSLETERRAFKDWEQLCSDVKFESAFEEMLQIQQNVQTVFDRKNAYIERLFGDRAEMEDIYSRNLQRLKRLIDCYLEIHSYFTTNLSKQYGQDCNSRLSDFRQESTLKENHANECIQQMEGAVISLEEATHQSLTDDRVGFIKKNDENINTHIERRERLRDRKIHQMEQIHDEIKSVAANYLNTILHPEKEKAYQSLFGADETSRRIIEGNRTKIRELGGNIKHLHKKITEVEIAGTRKVITKRLIKRNLEETVDTLKRRFNKMDEDHLERMKELAYEVFHVQKHLNKLFERGKLLLGIAQTCAKYECEDDDKYFKKLVDQGHTSANIPTEFEFFFDKINRVEAISVLLGEERDQLRRTNRVLQRQFKEYCFKSSPEANVASLQPTVRTVKLSGRDK